jgi:methionyl-tRNA formyltransferase
MRVFFAGSPGIAVPALKALTGPDMDDVCEVAGVLTNADSPRGRRGTVEPTELGGYAALFSAALVERGRPRIVIMKPEKLDAPFLRDVKELAPDLLISFAYGRIFKDEFLSLFPRGGINIHPSLLPKYRGPTPIQAAILNRDSETGISLQKLALEMDAGDILLQERFPLTGRETAASLGEIAAGKGAALLKGLIRQLAGGDAPGTVQNHQEAVYCRMLSKEDGRIDWNAGALDIDARIRAFTPWPLSQTRHGDQELFILEGRPWDGDRPAGTGEAGTVLGIDKGRGILIQTGDGIFAAERLQYRTRKALDWRSFLNGAPGFIGARLV